MLMTLDVALVFPAVSVNVAPATDTDPEPEAVSAVGVKMTV